MIKRTGRTPDPKFASLFSALRELSPTGPQGFEGLVRDLLSSVTGQPFRLLKSGHQGGVDAASESDGNALSIGIEGKRFGYGTSLPLDQLKAKLVDAIHARPGLDLWLLATTREVSGGDVRALETLGEREGVAVAVLDASNSLSALPALAVLCACAPEVVAAHLGKNANLDRCLASLQAEPGFEVARDQLRQRLTRPDVGYASARRYMAAWMRRSFTNLSTAKANLGSFANLLDPSVKLVRRPKLLSSFSQWQTDGHPAALPVLGDEGTGKTWAVLSWWHASAGVHGDDLPLTIFLPARDVRTSDAETLIAEALATRTEMRSAGFWRRRLRLWRRDLKPGRGPKLLVIIDGLNQNWMYNGWSRLLQPLFADPWEGQVAVMLTCRPDHWHDALGGLPDLQPLALVPTQVRPFDNEELEYLFAQHDLCRRDFSDAVVQLMRVPRLFRLAVQERDALEASGDITPERLVYEDWKDRLSIQGGETLMSDRDFRAFVTDRGRRLRSDLQSATSKESFITRAELFAELGRDRGATRDDLLTTISELVDGGWLQSTNRPHQFRLQRDRAPFALALALVEDLQSLGASEGLAERLADFFDPLRGQDFGVAILRAASTIALAEPNCPAAVRRCLIEAWYTSQNFRSEDFEAFWRLVSTDPDLFLEQAEAFWMNQGKGTREDEIFIKALATAHDRPRVAARLRDRAVRWMAAYWPDPDIGRFLGRYDPNTQRAEGNRQATARRRREWDEHIAPRLEQQPPLRCVEHGDMSWFAHRAVGVLSFLPRLPFVPAVVAWSASRAVMDCSRHFDEIAWLLRHNPHDPAETETAIISEAEKLLSLDHPIATQAARWLLQALATPTAAKRAGALLQPEPPTWGPWPKTVRFDPATNTVRWKHREARAWPRSEAVPLDATLGLSAHAINPRCKLPKGNAAVLRRLAGKTNPALLWSAFGQTAEDSGFETAVAPLARWAPRALSELIRRAFDTAEARETEAVVQLALRLPTSLLVLRGQQRAALLAAVGPLDPSDERNRCAHLYAFLAAIEGKSASRQIDLIAALPKERELITLNETVFAAPVRKDYAKLARKLTSNNPTWRLCRLLGFLSVVPLIEMPQGYTPLRDLVAHGDAGVRSLVMRIIWRSNDRALLRVLLESDWRFTDGMNRDEAAYGSLALCDAATAANAGDVRRRIDRQALGALAVKLADDTATQDAFAAHLHDQLTEALAGGVRSIQRRWTDDQEAIDLLVKRKGDEVLDWLAPLLADPSSTARRFLLFDAFPVEPICLSLLRQRPPDGAKLWSSLIQIKDHSVFEATRIELLPIEAPDSTAVDELRDQVLDRATTDQALGRIAETVVQHGCQEWLIRCIKRDLHHPSAAFIARAITLAGLLDTSPAADKLWREELAEPPSPGWLGHVYARARMDYERNTWAHCWFDRFIDERNSDRAFAYFVLFLVSADHRARAWSRKRMQEAQAALVSAWRTHWRLCRQELNRRIEKDKSDQRNKLYYTKTMERTQAPWL